MSIRDYVPSDAGRWLALINTQRDDPLTLERFEARERAWPPGDFRLRRLHDGPPGPAAIGQLSRSPYVPEDHLSTLVVVDGHARRRGIGGAMLGHLRRAAEVHGYRGLTCDLRETDPDALAWARLRGFRDHLRRFESALDLTRLDPETPRRLVRELRRRGIVLSGADEEGTAGSDPVPFFRDRLAETPDLEHMPPWDLERCRAVLRTGPSARADWITLARRADDLLGIAVMHRLGRDAYVHFVGVRPDARGRGLATALLAVSAKRAADEGYRLLRIDNMDRNLPALRVNERLGFVRGTGRIELRWAFEERDGQAARLP